MDSHIGDCQSLTKVSLEFQRIERSRFLNESNNRQRIDRAVWKDGNNIQQKSTMAGILRVEEFARYPLNPR
ncbi:hypothetical protein AFLA_007591 [Aspergillus flavus NRRL3357]|nr:hypothetical protein AFLA_007591 [Aspergillus flavus NRRL3357]